LVKKRAIYKYSEKRRRERFSIVSSITNKKVIYTQLVKGSIKKEQFIDFMKETIKRTNNRSSYLMDNARIHKSKELGKLIDNSKRKIIYNVPYSPENNPIEMVFSKVKLLVKKKRINEIVNDLKRNIINGFKKITKADLMGYVNHSLKK
jgi:transposase